MAWYWEICDIQQYRWPADYQMELGHKYRCMFLWFTSVELYLRSRSFIKIRHERIVHNHVRQAWTCSFSYFLWKFSYYCLFSRPFWHFSCFLYFSYNVCTVLDPLDAVVICLNLLSYSNEVCCNCKIMLLSIIIISSIWYTNTTTKYTSTIVPNWRNYMDRFSTILRVVLFNVFPFICELKTLIYRFSQG